MIFAKLVQFELVKVAASCVEKRTNDCLSFPFP